MSKITHNDILLKQGVTISTELVSYLVKRDLLIKVDYVDGLYIGSEESLRIYFHAETMEELHEILPGFIDYIYDYYVNLDENELIGYRITLKNLLEDYFEVIN